MSLVRKLTRPAVSGIAVWVGRRMLRTVQKRTAKAVTAKGGRTIARRGLSGMLIAAASAAAIAALKVGVDHALSDRKDAHRSEFDVFDDDEN